jgi:hypothetical protein
MERNEMKRMVITTVMQSDPRLRVLQQWRAKKKIDVFFSTSCFIIIIIFFFSKVATRATHYMIIS